MVFISFQNHFECYINSRIPVCSKIVKDIYTHLHLRIAYIFKEFYFTDCSKAVLLFLIISVIYVSRLSLLTVLSLPCTLVITCLERANLLAFWCVMVPCVLSFCNMMSSGRCGT